MTMEDRIASLEHELAILKDIQSVRALQFKYGYYMDKCLFPAIVDLFAEDCELFFMGGVFRGRAGARRLYGGASGLNGPADGMLFEHIIAQDIVDIAPDRTRAFGRFRCFMQGGVHESHPVPPANIPSAFWEAGVYENEYARVDGIWRIKRFDYRVVWQAEYDKGWSRSPLGPLMVSRYDKTFPDNPHGPDALCDPPPRWPKQAIVPFHYPHPVTGERVG